MTKPIRIGVSACLLGEKVRYDGRHKLDMFVRDTLGRYFDFVPVCPEVECGLPVPREPMHLAGSPKSPRLIVKKTGADLTGKIIPWARKRVRELKKIELFGFIFKTKSPSCGLRRIKVYCDDGMIRHKGTGLFAQVFMENLPLVPVEDNERIHDISLRENFIERIFTLSRWRACIKGGKKKSGLAEFHAKHRLLILSHSHEHFREMEKMVTHAKGQNLNKLHREYELLLLEAMEKKATRSKHVKVLRHILGQLKKDLTPWESREIIEIIERYGKGDIPLLAPITLVNHYIRKYELPHLSKQYYLNPHPTELRLRNHP